MQANSNSNQSRRGFVGLIPVAIGACLVALALFLASYNHTPTPKTSAGVDKAAGFTAIEVSPTVKVFVLTVDGQRVLVMENTAGGGAVGALGAR